MRDRGPSAPATGTDGTWCPTIESNEFDCFTIAGGTVSFAGGAPYDLQVVDDSSSLGCLQLTAVSGMDGGPLGSYCPAGVPIELYDYFGDPQLGVDRTYNAQTGSLFVRE